MGVEKYKPTKKDLLLELESIRDILDEDVLASLVDPSEKNPQALLFSANYLASIPKLTNEVKINSMQEDQAKSEESTDKIAAPENIEENDEVPTPNQQPLFEASEVKKDSAEDNATQTNNQECTPAKSENPFLPPHIRERLDKSKQHSLVEELNQLGEALERSRKKIPTTSLDSKDKTEFEQVKRSKDCPVDSNNDIVDDLVKQYLPIIEKELRQRLKSKLLTETEHSNK